MGALLGFKRNIIAAQVVCSMERASKYPIFSVFSLTTTTAQYPCDFLRLLSSSIWEALVRHALEVENAKH